MKHTPKKSLGQNFLKDKLIVKKIVESANLKSDDFVIEVGPGEGVLTEELGKYAEKILAIEIDHNLIKPLQKKFENKKNVEIINADILKINLPELLRPPMSKYKVTANLPYYITSPIIRLFLEAEFPPEEMILMVQKEVAERIVAKPGKMSILAVSVQYYASAEILFEVSRKCFDPAPEVDSAVIKIIPSPDGRGWLEKPGAGNKKFFRIVKAGFSAKRKTLINNLSSSFHLDKKETAEKLKKAGVSPTARAQELSIAKWKILIDLF